VFWLLSQPRPHLRFNVFIISQTSVPRWQFLDPVVNRFIWQTLSTLNRKHFFMNILHIESIFPQRHTTDLCFSVARSPFLLLKPASEHAHARLLPRLSLNWTVLLSSDPHRITSITAVLLPFVAYLLSLPRARILTCIVYVLMLTSC
jgi:hypothetical protein